jgi:hypothetical protein
MRRRIDILMRHRTTILRDLACKVKPTPKLLVRLISNLDQMNKRRLARSERHRRWSRSEGHDISGSDECFRHIARVHQLLEPSHALAKADVCSNDIDMERRQILLAEQAEGIVRWGEGQCCSVVYNHIWWTKLGTNGLKGFLDAGVVGEV